MQACFVLKNPNKQQSLSEQEIYRKSSKGAKEKKI